MPSLEHITQSVAASASRHIVVEAGRCVKVRHRLASCQACVEACPEGALSIEGNRIDLAAELCAGCGSCASACPTQALRTKSPSLAQLLALIDELAPQLCAQQEGEGGKAASATNAAGAPDAVGKPDAMGKPDAAGAPSLEFACEHATPSSASARVIVPGLPYVDEAVILHAAAKGFRSIALTSCNQPGCLQPTLAAMPPVVAAARTLLEAAGARCSVSLRREKPQEPSAGDATEGKGKGSKGDKGAKEGKARKAQASTLTASTIDAVHGAESYSRRTALSDVATQVRSIVADTAAAELRERLGTRAEEPTLRQTITDGKGRFLKFPMPRSQSLIDDLYLLNPNPTGTLPARGFATVAVNAQACTRCGMCAKFCPTGALQGEAVPVRGMLHDAWGGTRREEGLREGEQPGSLRFRPSDCVGCRLCEAACPLKCLSVSDGVDASRIFELEPADLLSQDAS